MWKIRVLNLLKKATTEKINNYLLLLFLFLLPLHTRYIYAPATLYGQPWEYGTLSLFATEILLWVIVLLFAYKNYYKTKIWRQILTKKQFEKHWQVSILVFGVFIFMFFVLATSLSQRIAWQHMFWLLSGACLGLVIIKSTVSKPKMLLVLWFSGIYQGMIAIAQFFAQRVEANKWFGMSAQNPADVGVSVIQHIDERWLRAYGGFGWPNSLGVFLAVTFVIGLIIGLLILQQKSFKNIKRVHKYVFAVGQLIILSGLLLSFSRGAWLATLAGMAMLGSIIFLQFKKGLIRPEVLKIFGWQLLIYLLYTLVIIIFLAPLFQARFNLLNSVERVSLQEHKMQYVQSSKVISSNLFFGTGPGNYTLFLSRIKPGLEAWQYQPAHNIYVLWVAEMGVTGLLIFVAFFTLLGFVVYKRNRLLLSLVIVLLVHGLFDHYLWTLYTGLMLWWVVWAIALPKRP